MSPSLSNPSPSQPDRAPDLTERVVGYRAFKLRTIQGHKKPYLVSPYMATEWDVVTHAGYHDGHRAPDPGCMSCGLYGLWTPEAVLQGHIDFPDIVIAGCTFWGRIMVHASGLRAEYAQVHALAPTREGWAALANAGMSPGMRALARADPGYFESRYGDQKAQAHELGLIGCRNLQELEMVTREFGSPMPDSLKPSPFTQYEEG